MMINFHYTMNMHKIKNNFPWNTFNFVADLKYQMKTGYRIGKAFVNVEIH